MGTDSVYQTNRYSLTPTKSLSYDIQATYSEPIFKAMFLQFSYKFTYKYNKSDRATYDFSNLGDGFFDNVISEYRGWNNYFSLLNNPLNTYLDSDLSRYSEYKNYIHALQVMLRVIRPKYNFNVGVLAQPQTTHFIQKYQGVNTDTVRNVINVTPTLDFRYRFSKLSNLRINYRGTTTQPSMTDLMDITDDSDPLNITKGNPGLKPSFTNSFRLFYNTYIQDHQRAIMTFINYNNTRNSISNMVTYDEKLVVEQPNLKTLMVIGMFQEHLCLTPLSTLLENGMLIHLLIYHIIIMLGILLSTIIQAHRKTQLVPCKLVNNCVQVSAIVGWK